MQCCDNTAIDYITFDSIYDSFLVKDILVYFLGISLKELLVWISHVESIALKHLQRKTVSYLYKFCSFT